MSDAGDISLGSGSEISSECSFADQPPEVQRRVEALKNIQVEKAHMDLEFFKEVHQLEIKYGLKYKGLYDRRQAIVVGNYEPTDAECVPMLNGPGRDDEDGDGERPTVQKKPKMDEEEKGETVSGIPGFWLVIFNSLDIMLEMIQEHDESILMHLTDVQTEMTEKPAGFKLLFNFSPNDYFSNPVLTKTYEMNFVVNPKDPFSFQSPKIYKCHGCEIDWKQGKKVTGGTVVDKDDNGKEVTSVIPSFFDYFSRAQSLDDGGEDWDDFKIGRLLHEYVIPRAVLFYTGEMKYSDIEDEIEDWSDETESETDLGEEEEGGETEDSTAEVAEQHHESE